MDEAFLGEDKLEIKEEAWSGYELDNKIEYKVGSIFNESRKGKIDEATNCENEDLVSSCSWVENEIEVIGLLSKD
jgi:hypothetical protein